MSRKEQTARQAAGEFDVAYTVEAFIEDTRQINALARAVAAGKADGPTERQWASYRREFGEDTSFVEFAKFVHMRKKYGERGFRRFVRFDVVTDTLAAYRSEMMRLGLTSGEPADGGSMVRTRIPVDVIDRLLKAPILETPAGMTLGKEVVARILREAVAARDE